MVLTDSSPTTTRFRRFAPASTAARNSAPAVNGTPSVPSPRHVAGADSGRPNWARGYVQRLVWVDVLAVLWGAAGAHVVHVDRMNSELSQHPWSTRYLGVTLMLAACWLIALDWWGTRGSKIVGHGVDEYKRVFNATASLFGALVIGSYLFDLPIPRTYVLVMMPAGLLALLVGRFVARRWLHRRRGQGQFMSDVLVVGSRSSLAGLLTDLARVPHAGYRVIGVCVDPATATDAEIESGGAGRHPGLLGTPILGGLDDVAGVALRSGAHAVAITATDAFGPAEVRRLSWELEDSEVELILAPALTNIAGPRIHTQPVAGLPFIHVERPQYRGANRILKKSFDLVVGALALAVLSPVLIVIAAIVKLTDRGPVFFRQERIGLNGDAFQMVKFRSMVPNAEALLPALAKARAQAGHVAGNEVLFKMADDPRVTTIGKILRRYSLDELPQLFNVLTGAMSLVGPRPPLKSEVDMYGDDALRRLLVKPGMTGLWQVSGRSSLTWEDTVRLDVYYVENWSIASDLMILWKTARAVVSSSGAY